MTREQFTRLVENIRADGVLTSVPFACRDEDGGYTVLSGNHRVEAAIEAGLAEIPLMVTDDPLPEQRRIAVQLAHNAVVGKDDPAVLAQLWGRLESVDWKQYAGLDDEVLAQLEKVTPASISESNLRHRVVAFLFLPTEVEEVDAAFDAAHKEVGAEGVYLAAMPEFDRLLNAFAEVEKRAKVRNRAAALRLILDVFDRNASQLAT